jgi:hypothetical protein
VRQLRASPAYCQNEAKMSENGRNAATQLEPAPAGNRRAATHLAYVTFTPAELEEVRALEDEIRAVCPVESPTVEPAISVLAGLLWRRAKLYAYLNEHGFTRGRADRATLNPANDALTLIERQVMESMRQLAMLPKDAAALKLTLAQTARVKHEFDLDRLEDDERQTLEALVAKAEAR